MNLYMQVIDQAKEMVKEVTNFKQNPGFKRKFGKIFLFQII